MSPAARRRLPCHRQCCGLACRAAASRRRCRDGARRCETSSRKDSTPFLAPRFPLVACSNTIPKIPTEDIQRIAQEALTTFAPIYAKRFALEVSADPNLAAPPRGSLARTSTALHDGVGRCNRGN